MTEVATSPVVPAPTRARGHRVREALKDLLLVMAAGLGVLCLGWLVFAQVTGAQLIVFRTGSMSPGLPQGAVAISLPTPAADLAVGDVVTAHPAPGARPVTHRIVSIGEVPGRPEARHLVLQGDANATADLSPYEVTAAPRVLVGVPFGASLLDRLQSTGSMVALSCSLGLLICCSLWPTRGPRGGARRAVRPDRGRTSSGGAHARA